MLIHSSSVVGPFTGHKFSSSPLKMGIRPIDSPTGLVERFSVCGHELQINFFVWNATLENFKRLTEHFLSDSANSICICYATAGFILTRMNQNSIRWLPPDRKPSCSFFSVFFCSYVSNTSRLMSADETNSRLSIKMSPAVIATPGTSGRAFGRKLQNGRSHSENDEIRFSTSAFIEKPALSA